MSITYKEITKLPEYREIIALGCMDTTPPLLQERLNFRFENNIFGQYQESGWLAKTGDPYKPGTLTVYQNGYVRSQFSRTPTPIPNLKTTGLLTKDAWQRKLVGVRKYILRKILRDGLGVEAGAKVAADHDSMADSIKDILTKWPNAYVNWIINEPGTTQALLMDVGGEATEDFWVKAINDNPRKFILTLKDSYKGEAMERIVNKLDPSIRSKFKKDLDLLGDLSTLGI